MNLLFSTIHNLSNSIEYYLILYHYVYVCLRIKVFTLILFNGVNKKGWGLISGKLHATNLALRLYY